MKLYHGSTIDIQGIDLAKSKPNKDFGRAFYLSVDEFLKRIQYIKGATFQYAFCTQKAVDKLIKL